MGVYTIGILRRKRKLQGRWHEDGRSLTRAAPEILSDRFGALEAVAYSSIFRYVSACEMSMDLLVAEAMLEFGGDLRAARQAATKSTGATNIME